MIQMASAEQLNIASKAIKGDWKSLASLLIAALIFVGGTTWTVTGYIVRGAELELRTNTEKITAMESRQAIFDAQLASVTKRQDEALLEIKNDMKSVSTKLNSVAESQARMEGVILGSKK